MKRTEALEVFKVEMKKRGFKKYNNIWYKKLDDITQILWVQHSQFSTDNYQIRVAVAMNKHMTRPYPVFQEWLFYISIPTYDYENDGLGTTPEERHENIEKLRQQLSREEYKEMFIELQQPDPYKAIEIAMPYFDQMSTVEKLIDFIRTSPAWEVSSRRDFLLDKLRKE